MWSDVISTIFWGVVTFSILIIMHEGGHFFAARAFGVKVHEFMLGLPGPALRWRGKKTTYGITAIPLGGYVRIAGMEPGPEDPLLAEALAFVVKARRTNPAALADHLHVDLTQAEDLLRTLTDWGALEKVPGQDYEYDALMSTSLAEDPVALLNCARSTTYRALPTWKRVVVLSMGVVVNLTTAVLVFTIVLSLFGYYRQALVVDRLLPGGGAAAAGLVAGDKITAVGSVKLKEWTDLVKNVSAHKAGDVVAIAVVRDGKAMVVPVKLGLNPSTGGGFLGVSSVVEKVHPTPPQALMQSFGFVVLVFQAIGDFFRPSTFQQSVNGARSIIGVSAEVNQAVKNGPLDYAWIVALLSLSLGAMNILPIPPLDGGKVAMELVEGVSGRPLPRSVVIGFSVVGAALLFTLIGYLMYADTIRYIIHPS